MRDGHVIRAHLGPLGFTIILTRNDSGAYFLFGISVFKLALHFGLSTMD